MQEIDAALEKARRLVAAIESQKAELDASPSSIPPETMARGRQAFEDALASAKRMLAALESAARTPARPLDEPTPQPESPS